jgi:hypothetical protein
MLATDSVHKRSDVPPKRPGRIVDEYEQRALRAAILELPMLAPVDLHQFTHALRAGDAAGGRVAAPLAVKPQPVGNRPMAHRLAGADRPAVQSRSRERPQPALSRRAPPRSPATSGAIYLNGGSRPVSGPRHARSFSAELQRPARRGSARFAPKVWTSGNRGSTG